MNQNENNQSYREMTFDEWMDQLPKDHQARRYFRHHVELKEAFAADLKEIGELVGFHGEANDAWSTVDIVKEALEYYRNRIKELTHQQINDE